MSNTTPGLYPVETSTRQWRELSGMWKFQLDRQGVGRRQNWKNGLPHPSWTAVPASCGELFPDLRDFTGDVWYETAFYLPEDNRDRMVELRFEGVTDAADIWLNGHKVGAHSGDCLPFAVTLHAAARFGQRNQLVVAVTPAPGDRRAGRYCTGLDRPVKLVFRPRKAIRDISLAPSLAGDDGVLEYQVTASFGLVRVAVFNASGSQVAAGEGASGRLRIAGAIRWEPGCPYLYTFRASLYSAAGKLLDEYELETGIRTLAVVGAQLLLNGSPIYCKGFVWQETSPLHGRGLDPAVMLRDFALLEWIGANTVHAAGPCSEEFLRMADRRGLLVIDTAPAGLPSNGAGRSGETGNGAASQREDLRVKPRKTSTDLLREWIGRAKNHPSVVLWDLSVGTGATDAGADFLAEERLAYVRSLDPQQRPIGLAAGRAGTADASADVLLLPCRGLSDGEAIERTALAELRAEWKTGLSAGKPLLATAYGTGPAAEEQTRSAAPWTEQAQCLILEQCHRMLDESDSIAGELTVGFADSDGDGRSQHLGVFTQNRQPKQAACLLKERWAFRGAKAASGSMNILVTLNAAYINPLRVMLFSLLYTNPGTLFDVYILHSSLSEQDLAAIAVGLDHNRCRLHPIPIQDDLLNDAPITDRYPKEMYYRIFAAKYLPESLDRILYLDPDMVVNGRLDSLYATELDHFLFAAASHVKGAMQKLNELRLDMEGSGPYINSGVMLMHLALLRQEQDDAVVFRYIREHKNLLLLPDQDVISGIYASRILPLDPYRYNMTERLYTLRLSSEAWLDLDWVRRHSAIIHYCGRNKPWKQNYLGTLNIFYQQAALRLERAEAEEKQRRSEKTEA